MFVGSVENTEWQNIMKKKTMQAEKRELLD